MPSTPTNEHRMRPAVAAGLPAIIALLVDDTLGRTREEVIGCFQLSFIPGRSRLGLWRGQIESVRIAADRRGGGLGHSMMVWAIEQCRQRGCRLVQLTTEILWGELHLSPRPARPHAHSAFGLGVLLGGPFWLGQGGPWAR